MPVNTSQESRLWAVFWKMFVLKALGFFFPAFTAEGLNDPYGSEAMKEQLTERTPPDACSNYYFLQVYFYHFWFLILSVVADPLELLIVSNAY